MAKFRKKPIVIEAEQWFKNGDHSEDGPVDHEGKVVRYYRYWLPPSIHGDMECGIRFGDHGWIDTLEGGHIVCPGDWIITGVKGERYPCKPNIFEATYESVNEENNQ